MVLFFFCKRDISNKTMSFWADKIAGKNKTTSFYYSLDTKLNDVVRGLSYLGKTKDEGTDWHELSHDSCEI